MIKNLYIFIKSNLFDVRTYKWMMVGFLSFVADYTLYIFLLNYIQIDISKALGVLLGILISFTMNRNWTFNSKTKVSKEAKKFATLYMVNLILNVLVNKYIYYLTNDIKISYFISLFITIIIGFVGQKYWVFKKLSN